MLQKKWQASQYLAGFKNLFGRKLFYALEGFNHLHAFASEGIEAIDEKGDHKREEE